jgi:branched-chain amino acid transport system substrate-binding protein
MFKQSLLFVALAATLSAMPVQAQDKISGGVVKIGVLTDLSGLYMCNVGPG